MQIAAGSGGVHFAILMAGCGALIATSCAVSPTGLGVAEPFEAGASTSSVSPPSKTPDPAGAVAADASSPEDSPGVPDRFVPPDSGVVVVSSPDAAQPAVAPDATAPTETTPSPDTAPRIIRAHNIMADRIKAGVVYAHRLDAKSGTVGQVGEPLPAATLAAEIGRMDLKVSELVTDVLYAQDIQADRVEIVETHVSAVKIDKPDP